MAEKCRDDTQSCRIILGCKNGLFESHCAIGESGRMQ